MALGFMRRLLLMDFQPYLTGEQKDERLKFVMRWQQFTGPIMAKGLEDTALYVYNPLISINEVGTSFRTHIRGSVPSSLTRQGKGLCLSP